MTSALFPVFLNRSFAAAMQPTPAGAVRPGIKFEVNRLSWEAQGGCAAGRLVAQARGPLDLDQFAALLRRGVVIYSAAGRAVWWGLVWSVRIQDGSACPPEGGDKVGAWLSLDDLSNRVRTIYGRLEPEATAGGVRMSTPWVDDLTSQGIYGIKESQSTLALANAAQADSLNSTNLAQRSRISPRVVITPLPLRARPGRGARYHPDGGTGGAGLGSSESVITVDLRGYWQTLDWRFYTNATGLIQHITRQPNYLVAVGKNPDGIAAQQITVPAGGSWQVETIWFKTKRQGDPRSTLTASIRADSAGSPGTVLGSGTLDGTAIDDTRPVWLRYVLATPAVVSAGVYWITLGDNSNQTDSYHYQVHADRLAGYAGGSAKMWTGAAWSSIGPDIEFIVAGTMETTDQIKVMAAASGAGQFLAGVRVDQPSGIFTNPQRAGDTTALDEIRAHLAAGTSGGVKLQAAVTAERWLVVGAQPEASAARWIVRSDGIIRLPGGQAAPPGADLAGNWAILDTKWASNSANWLHSPGRVFIDRAEWSGGVCRGVSGEGLSG